MRPRRRMVTKDSIVCMTSTAFIFDVCSWWTYVWTGLGTIIHFSAGVGGPSLVTDAEKAFAGGQD